MDLVRELNDRYGGNLYPSSVGDVDDKVNQFRNVFPKKSRPSSRAAFLFGWSGEPLWKSEFEIGTTNVVFGAVFVWHYYFFRICVYTTVVYQKNGKVCHELLYLIISYHHYWY